VVTKKDEYQNMVEAQLNKWCLQVEKMLAQATQIEAEALVEQLQKLVDKQGTAQLKLQALKEAGSEHWPPLKTELDHLMTELQHEFDQARAAAYRANIQSIGWAEGIAKEDEVQSIGWAEGLAEEAPIKSIGWAEGIAEEDPVESVGWGEGYEEQ
jgi:hypothetical protein